MMSPNVPKTPVLQQRMEIMQTHSQSTNIMTTLTTHLTPPSGITKFIAQNPFEADLTSRLHLSVISPTVFNTRTSNSPADQFKWTVDELARCQPAKIDELLYQQSSHTMSPETEKEAQEAIRRFFAENQIAPSPIEVKPKDISRKLDMSTPTTRIHESNSFVETPKAKKDCWTQTVLTLPSKLPEEVEEALKPFFTFTQEQNVEAEDANSTNSSLRRKLFDFQESDNSDDSDVERSLSPIRRDSFTYENCSPPQSGILVDCTPLRGMLNVIRRDHGSPMNFQTPIGRGSISPINISPICNFGADAATSPNGRNRGKSKSVARLDFTADMSVEEDGKEYTIADMTTPENKRSSISNFSPKMQAQANRMKGSPTIYSSTLQQNHTLFNQQCTLLNSHTSQHSQDTGYQTCSISNMETNENENMWTDNAEHIFCSTPSKFRQIVQ